MPNTQIAKKENYVDRFTNKVVREFTGGDHTVALTSFQKRLVQNYFIGLNSVLARAEEGRLKKNEKYRDPVPVTWENINMEQLVQDVVAVARIGFDPAQRNHINMIPYKNNTTKLYDIGFIEGYRGIELKSTKYGLDIPDAVIVELVFSTDEFKSYKKDRHNAVETYDFKVVNDFDRGEIVGGFYYHAYTVTPEKNKLIVMSLEDIEKRKPRYASVEFWGGEKSVWENGKKTTKTEAVRGWYKEMCRKTISRAAYSDITIDSQKIDTDYLRMKEMEGSVAEHNIQSEIAENANKAVIDIEEIDTPKEEEPSSVQQEEIPNPSPMQDKIDTTPKTAKKQKQLVPIPSNPDWVAELNKWLDSVKPSLLVAAMERIEKDSFPKLCEEDREKVRIYYDELSMTEFQGPDF